MYKGIATFRSGTSYTYDAGGGAGGLQSKAGHFSGCLLTITTQRQ